MSKIECLTSILGPRKSNVRPITTRRRKQKNWDHCNVTAENLWDHFHFRWKKLGSEVLLGKATETLSRGIYYEINGCYTKKEKNNRSREQLISSEGVTTPTLEQPPTLLGSTPFQNLMQSLEKSRWHTSFERSGLPAKIPKFFYEFYAKIPIILWYFMLSCLKYYAILCNFVSNQACWTNEVHIQI